MGKLHLSQYKKELVCILILATPSTIIAMDYWKGEQKLQIDKKLEYLRQIRPAKPKPVQAQPTQAKPVPPRPTQVKPVQVKPTQVKPIHEPVQAPQPVKKPAPSKPTQVKPAQAKKILKSDQEIIVKKELAQLKQDLEKKKVIATEQAKKRKSKTSQQIQLEKELSDIKKQKVVTFEGVKYDLNNENDWKQLKILLPENDETLYKKQYKDEEYTPGRKEKLIREKNIIFTKLTLAQKKELEKELEIAKPREIKNMVIDKLLHGTPISETEWNKAREYCKTLKFDPQNKDLESEIYIVNEIILKYPYNKAKINDYSEMAYKKDESVTEGHIRERLIDVHDITLREKEQLIKEFKEQRRKDMRKDAPKPKQEQQQVIKTRELKFSRKPKI